MGKSAVGGAGSNNNDHGTFVQFPHHHAVADDWCWGAEAEGEGHAVEAETEQRSRRRARQSIREYELIWLLQQRLRAVSWPHWRLRCMQPLHGHGMGVVRP